MKITQKILVFILVFTALKIGVAYYFEFQNTRQLMLKTVEDHEKLIDSRFRNDVRATVGALATSLEILEDDQVIKEAYLSNDRELLYATALPLFERIKKNSEITHFYFIRPDGTCFLRVHDKDTFDDQIKRASFLESAATGGLGSGIELGKNVFAIRVVKPYYDGDQLVGYVEFSKEIGSFLEVLRQETGHVFTLFGDKRFLSQSDWSAIRAKRGLSDNWEQYPDVVDLAESQNDHVGRDCFTGPIINKLLSDTEAVDVMRAGEKEVACSSLPISNKSGERIATLIIGHDLTETGALSRRLFGLSALATAGVASVVAVIMFFIILRIIIRPISLVLAGMGEVARGNYGKKVRYESGDELGNLARGFNDMSEELAEANAQLRTKARILADKLQEISRQNEELEKAKLKLSESLQTTRSEKQRCDFMSHDLEKFKLAVDNASDFVVITDPEGVVLYANRAAQALSGCTLEELGNRADGPRCLWGGLMDDAYFRQLWQTVKVERKAFVSEARNVSKTGREYRAAVSVTPVMEENGSVRFIVGIGRDVTKEKEAEKAKSTFVSLVSHQLRTPLTSIKWIIEILLSQDPGKLNAKQSEFLLAANDSTARLVLLINDLLNINHIEAGSLYIKIAETDYAKLIKEILAELDSQFKRKKLKVKKDLVVKLGLIKSDPLLLRQAILNIFANSIRYTPDKGTVGISTAVIGDKLITKISDTGIGIPAGEQAHIFERFFRASNVQGQFNDGTGLGLSLVKSVVETLGGEVGFSSELGRGTTVWFTLPLNR